MKLLIPISSFFLINISTFIFSASVQGQVTVPGAPVYRDLKAYDDHLSITGYDGGPFKNTYAGIEGSPYFLEYYCPANLLLNKGKEYKNILTKVNLSSHEIFVIDSNRKEIVVTDGLVIDVSLTDTSGAISRTCLFRCGYPPIEKNSSHHYYQVLSDGKLQLLKLTRKEIAEQKNIQSGEIRKEFVTRDEFYTYANGEIKKLKKDKADILELMKDKEQKINEYLKDKKMNYKNTGMLTGLFNFYNSPEKPF